MYNLTLRKNWFRKIFFTNKECSVAINNYYTEFKKIITDNLPVNRLLIKTLKIDALNVTQPKIF